jgi:hypothetical protein
MLKASAFLVIMLVLGVTGVHAQPNYWDMPTTEYLIEQNQKNYDDHKDFKSNQVVSQGTVNQWKNITFKLKNLTDSIDKRLSSFFIITADASTVLAIYTGLKDIYAYQSESIKLGYKYPYTIPVLISRQNEIIVSASSFVSFLTLIVNSYSDISKMKVSDRNIIYREIRMELDSMLLQMKQIDFANVLKGTKPYKFVNNDAQLVKSILKNF